MEEIKKIYEDHNLVERDYWSQLRNVWFGCMNKQLSQNFSILLKDNPDDIDPNFGVSTIMEPILVVFDKEFRFCSKYPKGRGEVFFLWMEEKHQDFCLLHVERAPGSLKYLVVKGDGVVYFNHPYCIEFIDDLLQLPGDNILQDKLFFILYLLEMVILTHIYSIINLSVCLPIQ